MTRFRPLLFLPCALVLAGCGAALGPDAADEGAASPATASGWRYETNPPRAAFGAEISATCQTTEAGAPVVVWAYEAPAAAGAGNNLTFSAGGLRATIAMTGVESTVSPEGRWVGTVSPNDPSRQVFAGANGPVQFALTIGDSVTAPDAGPVLEVYRACS